MLRAYPPVYTARTRDDWGFDLSNLKRRPMGAQGDAIRAVGEPATTRETHETREGKRLITDLPAARLQRTPAPLRAIYLLAPMAPDAGPLDRVRLPATVAALSVVAHVKIGRMLGAGAAGAMLQRAAMVSGQVPVYRLQLARALDQLPATAATLLAWHGGAS